MANLINKIQGDSLSIGIAFNAEYDVARLEHFYVYLDDILFTSSLVLDTIRVELKSEDTKYFLGNKKLTIAIDDINFGVRKKDIGYIYFAQSPTIYDASVNTGYDLVVSLQIDETSTEATVSLLEAFRGYSSYDIYVKYTTDDPILTEEEWTVAVNQAKTDAETAADEAEAAELAAKAYRNESLGFRNESEGFKNTAGQQATISTTKAGEANLSAVAALLSEQHSKTSEDNAKLSETAASGYKDTASTKATEAYNSAAAALVSEQHSKTSEDNAKASETAALGYKNTSEAQAVLSTNKALEASGYKDLAQAAANAYYLYNITIGVPLTAGNYYTLTTALAATPSGVKKLGLVLTFADTATTWLSYQFIGSSITAWTTIANWQRVITERELIPDERVSAEAYNMLYNKILALEEFIKNSIFETIQVDTLTTVIGFNYNGAALILTGTTAPSVTPDFIGQFYINTTGGTCYQAKGITNSGDWKQTA